MSKYIIIGISIIIMCLGYRMGNCKKCKYEGVLIGLIFLMLKDSGYLGIKMLLVFILGEILLKLALKGR